MEGWVCPTCKKVYAPFVAECAQCPMEIMTNGSSPYATMVCTCYGSTHGTCPVHQYQTGLTPYDSSSSGNTHE